MTRAPHVNATDVFDTTPRVALRMYMITDDDGWCSFVAANGRGKAKAYYVGHWSTYTDVEWTTPMRMKCIDKNTPFKEGFHENDAKQIAEHYQINLMWDDYDD